MTNDERDLIHDYLSEAISETKLDRLQSFLREKAEARRVLRDLATVDAKVRDLAPDNSETLQWLTVDRRELAPFAKTVASSQVPRRIWAAVAAGFLLGIFSSSVVWAFALPRPRGIAPPAVTRLTQDFEEPGMAWRNGFPKQVGEGSGDPARIIGSEDAVSPNSGKRMLRFKPAAGDFFSGAYDAVDLERTPLPPGVRQVKLAASCRPAVFDRRSRHLLRAASFAQEIAKNDPRWMMELWSEFDDQTLARAARAFPVLPGTDAWKTVSIIVDVPPSSLYRVVSLWAATTDGKVENRRPHFLDDVTLTCVLPEVLP